MCVNKENHFMTLFFYDFYNIVTFKLTYRITQLKEDLVFMQKSRIKRVCVFGIIVLFVGAGILSGISTGSKELPVAIMGANTWIVDDEGDGDFTSIQAAIDYASDGDTIEVYSGTYVENITIYKKLWLKGNSSEYLNGTDVGKPIINASFQNNTHTIRVVCNGIRLSGFNITGSGKEWKTVGQGTAYEAKKYQCHGILILSNDCNITDNSIYQNGHGIYISSGGVNVNISHCLVSNNSDDGIAVNEGRPMIYHNIIRYNGHDEPPGEPANNADGIELQLSPAGTSIIKNSIIGNHVDGIWVETCDRHIMTDNIIRMNKKYGIHLFDSRGNQIYWNNISENIKGGISLYNSDSNTIQNNTISNNIEFGINIQRGNNNKIHSNRIWYNKIGVFLFQTYENDIKYNDIRGCDKSLRFILSILDRVTENNIVTLHKIKFDAVLSFSIAILNWWGDVRGPWFNMNRVLLGFVLVFPWALEEFPIPDTP
jgi:parallel beta-helix repeat protein